VTATIGPHQGNKRIIDDGPNGEYAAQTKRMSRARDMSLVTRGDVLDFKLIGADQDDG